MVERVYEWWWRRYPGCRRAADRERIEVLEFDQPGLAVLDLGSRQASQTAADISVTRATGIQPLADPNGLPFHDEMFDAVWCDLVPDDLREIFHAAQEIARVLKPGGVALVHTIFPGPGGEGASERLGLSPATIAQLFPQLEELTPAAADWSAGHLHRALPESEPGRVPRKPTSRCSGVASRLIGFVDGILADGAGTRGLTHGYYIARKPRTSSASRVRAVFLIPPSTDGEFDEISRQRSHEMIGALREAGADTLALAVDAPAAVPFHQLDAEFVTGPNMNYVLAGAIDDASPVARLGRPATMIWDDPLGALALWQVWRRDGRLGWLNTAQDGDALERFRAVMAAPGTQHFSFDSGHIDAVVELGLAPRTAIEWFPSSTFSPFLDQGRTGQVEQRIDLSFCGNLYNSLIAESNFAGEPLFAALTERITARKLGDLRATSWELLRSEVEALPVSERDRWGLLPSRSEFWDYYLYVVWLVLTTAVRIDLMANIEHPIDVFGVFADPASRQMLHRHPNLRFGGHLHHWNELPETYAATKVNICITNGLIYKGVPTKLVDCLASGGFALVDAKDDLHRLFGDEVDAITFNDQDELNTKIEYYLARPRERREIVETLRRTVERHCELEHLSRRIVQRRDGQP